MRRDRKTSWAGCPSPSENAATPLTERKSSCAGSHFIEEKDGKATQIESQARDGSRGLAGSWVAVLSTATVTRNHHFDFAVAKRITSLSVKAIETIDKRKAKKWRLSFKSSV